MKVECKISKEYKEPCAVLYINRMTETIGKIISMLEKEHTDSPALIAAKDRKSYFIRPEDISLIRTEGREIVCYDKIKNSLVLRTRRPGDYLELSGGIRKKLKDFFIDCKVPREERSRRILLADGSHIVWVTGLRISENYKVTEQTRTILKVQMKENGGTEDGEAPY